MINVCARLTSSFGRKSSVLLEFKNSLKGLFDHRLQEWEDWNPKRWTPQRNLDMSMGDDVPLIYSSSDKPNAAWSKRGMATPTSMRSVDASCEAMVLRNRYEERDE